MAVVYLNYQAGQIPRTGGVTTTGFDIATITVYNNTPAFLAIFQEAPGVPTTGLPGGGVPIPPFYPQTIPVSKWRSFYFVTDGTAAFPTSSLVIQAQDVTSPTLPLSPFGTSAWGAASAPAVLTAINPGDQVLAWQVQQFFLFLTGLMAGTETIDGLIKTIGAAAGLSMSDRNGVGVDWEWYNQVGNFGTGVRLWNVTNGDIDTFSLTGDLRLGENTNGAGLILTSAPSTPVKPAVNQGMVWVDRTSGDLKYSSPAGTVTTIIAGP